MQLLLELLNVATNNRIGLQRADQLNIVDYCRYKDQTEKHFGDVGILAKYYDKSNNNH